MAFAIATTQPPSVRCPRAPGLPPSCCGIARSACGRSASTAPRNSFTIHLLAGAWPRCGRSRKTAQAPAQSFKPSGRLRALAEKLPEGSKPRVPRWTEAPHRSRLGALPPLALVGTRACFCRDRLSPRWGASFPLLRLGASHHGSPAWGACANFRSCRAQVFCHLSPVAGATCARLCARVRAKVLALRKRMGLRVLAQSKPNPHQTQDQSCSKCPSIVRQSSTKRQIKPR